MKSGGESDYSGPNIQGYKLMFETAKNQLFQYSVFFVNVKVFDSGTIRIVSLPTESNFSYIPLENYERDPTVYADAFWIKSEMINTENGMPYFDYDLIEDDMWTKDSFKTQWFIGGVSSNRLILTEIVLILWKFFLAFVNTAILL